MVQTKWGKQEVFYAIIYYSMKQHPAPVLMDYPDSAAWMQVSTMWDIVYPSSGSSFRKRVFRLGEDYLPYLYLRRFPVTSDTA